ncbi:nose resistant to fluoxetine protein 6-like [Ostrinia furnacalis]|uniref:nose resistant to fluoxetine protein 6-like n=1 Tax=Ostrinia furnacalis TaxID=93504 RepID=UPI00103CB7E7|nr:nose resistant to fluoxetine protein 6-like [Ostrinia furnacalis]XP_028173606.1 nose resistant to fluoxetine protein 6-like [Ostrinia furnacalis]
MGRLPIVFLCLVFASTVVYAEKDPEEDFRKLPKLFHLDDYNKCLARQDGIYCLGMFEIYNDVTPNPLYDLIQEKAQDRYLYNRSLLHRGYCLPTRCPSNETNASTRFERCVDTWARSHALRTRLLKLHYCHAHAQPRPNEPDTNDAAHRAFLYFIYLMIAMAGVGTVYDVFFAKKGSKNPYLMSFAPRINWNHLVSNYQDVDPRLRQLEVFHLIRYLMGVGLINYHVIILTSAVYQNDPRYYEKLLSSRIGFVYGATMTYTLTFVTMSNFLTGYNLLLLSDKIKFSWKMFPLLMIKRIIRMYPVYLLLLGFGATWWKSMGDGPMWPLILANESDVCRKKFWISAGFLQTFFRRKELCLVQTWIMAVDMQIHLFTLFLILVLLKYRQHAVKVISALLVVATAILAHQAYKHELVSSYLYVTPEVFRNFFIGADSFFDLYIHPVGALIAALAGVMLAFVHKDHQERNVNINNSKILIVMHHLALPLLYYWWNLSYVYFRHYDKSTQHLMVVIDRLFTASLASFLLYSLINYKGLTHRICSWRGLRVITRLSFSATMIHWCINCWLLANRTTLHDSSMAYIILDTIGVHVLSNIVAFPVTMFIEYPIQKFLDRVINNTGHRWFAPLKEKSLIRNTSINGAKNSAEPTTNKTNSRQELKAE